MITLTSIAENLSQPITRSGIHERFNKHASDFLWAVYAHLFTAMSRHQKSLNIAVLNQFRHVHIADSSSWKLPQGLQNTFAGYTGAGCKTQLMIDYKTGMIQHLDITPETYNDQKYSKNIAGLAQADDLMIFDLAYAMTENLKKINDNQGFFICRLNTKSVSIFVKEQQRYAKVDLLRLLKKLGDQDSILEIPCYAGNTDQKIKVRLLAIRVPEEIANQRRRKKNRQMQRQGYSPTKESLELCNYTFLITNAPQEKLQIREIIALYSLRWTIEIFFKQLKSFIKIHKTEVKSNPHRLRCEVLARCIVAMFISYCYSLCNSLAWRNLAREISFEKTVKFFKRNVAELFNKLRFSIQQSVELLRTTLSKIIQTCQKNRQHSRINALDVLVKRAVYPHLQHMKLSRAKLLALIA